MIKFDDITVYSRDKVVYNVYGVDNFNDEIVLTEKDCYASSLHSFDFATGFASALLSYEIVKHVFITKITISYNIWGLQSEDEVTEDIVWQGSVNPKTSD